MPKRTDIKSILILGAGPIVIGQACEFDYSGAQACKALREEGYRVILVNSNPATIMTDPEMADATYIEPIHWEVVRKIIEKERPDAVLPTMGGQTALNCALELERQGVLEEFGVTMIGATADAIDKAEDRRRFDVAMKKIGLETARSGIAHTMEEALAVAADVGFPCIIRPSFTMGGSGGGIAYNREEFEEICARGLDLSPTKELLIDESLIGWKEYEMEVVRDKNDNCIIVCSIENFDAMGIHTGDSITVAPAQTLTDKEYQIMRNASMAVLREIGVETGGSNVQFAVNPKNGRLIVIEMNPRVSRSSALASKATGFPIAKVAAKLAVGYTLDELMNDITGGRTPASFEPSIDYVVTKVPRFAFEKFPGADPTLTTSMKSVGEAMALAGNFQESLGKAMRSIDKRHMGFNWDGDKPSEDEVSQLLDAIKVPTEHRYLQIQRALWGGATEEQIFAATKIDPWFIRQFALINETALEVKNAEKLTRKLLKKAKLAGLSDLQIAHLRRLGDEGENTIRELRWSYDLRPVFKTVDTCAAEFDAATPYYYSCYADETELRPRDREAVIILGSGPNRIGQGIEFDYCCCHASFALKDAGVQAIMVNSNPETVSTDYDTSDRLYFEPLTFEDVMHIVEKERPDGVIVQFGGQTPLNLAVPLLRAGVPILGTSPDAIDRAEDRERFQALLQKLSLLQPANGTATTLEESREIAHRIGYPIVIRPSYVLGGRAMMIVYDDEEMAEYFALHVGKQKLEHPVLIDKFLENAIEVDVDALSDGEDVYVAGVMEHIEEAGIHSGDSSCVLPPYSLPAETVAEIERQTVALAKELRVVGLMNIQFAVKDGVVFILEVNPRASRTAPFVSKATGVPLPRLATQVMLGKTLKELDPWSMRRSGYVSVKESVFPFRRFPGVDILLGPEMRSTGEVMGIAPTFEEAFLKGQWGAGQKLPEGGKVFLSVNDRDKRFVAEVARQYVDLGFELLATSGTAGLLAGQGIPSTRVLKVYEGRPNIVDLIKNGEVSLVINTASGKRTAHDSKAIRQATLHYGVPYSTTLSGAKAIARAIGAARTTEVRVKSLQEYYKGE